MAEKTIPVVSYTASSGTVAVGGATLMGFTADEWAIIGILCGIATGIATFWLNAYFQWRRDQREEAARAGK